jgi:nitrate/nitrite-specific signal transduction histidine kinase
VQAGQASEVEVIVRHSGNFSAKVVDNGRGAGRAQALAVAQMLGAQSGLKLEITTGKSTIVSIRAHALRRAAG